MLLRGRLPYLKVGVGRAEKVTSPAGSSLLGRACHGHSNRCQRCVRIQFGPTGTGSHTRLLPELIEVHHNRGILPFAIQVNENGRPCRSITGLENTLYRPLGIDGALCRHDRLKSVLQPLAIARCFSDLDIGGRQNMAPPQYVRPQVWVWSSPLSPP